jgi:hypothetical protein
MARRYEALRRHSGVLPAMSSPANAGAVRDTVDGPRLARTSRGQVVTNVGQAVAAVAAGAAAVAAAVVAVSGAIAAFGHSPERPCGQGVPAYVSVVVSEQVIRDLDEPGDLVVRRP